MVDVGIVNYGIGNIRSFYNVYQQFGIPVAVVSTPDELRQAKRLILPGVGSFDWAMDKLTQSGLRQELEELVLGKFTPILGICVGMQMMAKRSEEGVKTGLSWIGGEVKKIDTIAMSSAGKTLPLPHMGWNDVAPLGDHPLFRGLTSSLFYFLHSFYFSPASSESAIAHTIYGHQFSCAVGAGNVMGVQFHPEKSHSYGIRLLNNFAEY